MVRNSNKLLAKILLVGLLSLINFFVWQAVLTSSQGSGLLTVTFLDVGQGDAILIDDSYGNQALIDGGNGKEILSRLVRNLPFYDRKIEALILTHPDYDHLGGILKVIKHYQIENFLYTGAVKQSRSYKQLLTLLQKEGLAMDTIRRGDEIVFGNKAFLRVLYPEKPLQGFIPQQTNNYCLISKLIFKNFSVLFAADANMRLESELLDSVANLRATVLKVAHHGSKYSSQAAFLARVSPSIAVISVGKDNSYHHPHQELLKRLKNTRLLRTDLNGDIKILTNGHLMRIVVEKP